MAQFPCPHCRYLHEIPTAAIGQPRRCSECGEAFLVGTVPPAFKGQNPARNVRDPRATMVRATQSAARPRAAAVDERENRIDEMPAQSVPKDSRREQETEKSSEVKLAERVQSKPHQTQTNVMGERRPTRAFRKKRK